MALAMARSVRIDRFRTVSAPGAGTPSFAGPGQVCARASVCESALRAQGAVLAGHATFNHAIAA